MDDYDPNPQTKIMSPNELNANMKNSIEQKLLLNQNKIYRNEYKNNCLVIKNMKINAESLYDAIKKTTGPSCERIEKVFKTTSSLVC